MKHLFRVMVAFATPVLVGAAVRIDGQTTSAVTGVGVVRGSAAEDRGGHVDSRLKRAGKPRPRPAPAALSSADPPTALAPAFFFLGGKILQSPEVIAVFWGRTIPDNTRGRINALYATLAGPRSRYFAALAEYDTASPPQAIGFPSYVGTLVDTAVPTSGIVTDLQVQAELARLVDTGALPAPDGRNVYMVHFPPEVVVNGTFADDPNPSYSCSDFFGYHSYFPRNGVMAYYSIVAECPVNRVGTSLDQIYYTASHELVEVTTDPESSGWFDFNFGEVGDACEFFPGVKFDGFPIQPYYSMQDGGCRVAPSTANMTISVSPDFAFLPPGASATFTITASGAVQKKPATLGLLFPPVQGTATFDQPTILAGQTAHVTFTNSSLFATRIQEPWVYALDVNDDFHYELPVLVMDGLAPTITSVSPGHGGSQGEPGVTIQGSNFRSSTQVLFGDQPAAVQGVFAGGTQLQVYTPSQPPGTVDVSVTSVTGQTDTLAGGYTVDPGVPPTVLSIVPGSGPAAGGYVIRMVGRNFSYSNFGPNGNLNMTIGGTPAFNVTYTSATAAVVVPGGPLGPQDVVVANPDGLFTTLSGGFRYASGFNGGGPPVPTSLSVSSGSHGGGTYVTVYGLNFDEGAQVFVGGAAAQVLSTSDYFAGVVTAPHAPGLVDVKVVNSDGSANTLPGAFTYQ